MNEKLEHIGPMYKKLGLNTDSQLIAGRIAAAQAAYEELDQNDVAALLRTALGRALPDDMDGLVDEIKKVDVTFDADSGQREMALIATAILRQAIDEGNRFGERAALAVVTSTFGGLRTLRADPELANHAQHALTLLQDEGLPTVAHIKSSKRPNLDDAHASLQTLAPQNSFSAAYEPLKKILESAPTYTETAYRVLVQQLNSLALAHNRVAEQMNVHWWVLNGWSLDERRPFSDLSASDAGVRIGVELARLTQHSPLGLFAAPALLSRVLDKAGHRPAERVRLGEAASASPIEWRRSWASEWLDHAASKPLLPLTLAVASAVDAGDARDWEPRYERACAISPDAPVELLGLAHQMYLESLLRATIGT